MEAIVEMNVNAPKNPWIGVGKTGEWSDVREAMNICDLDFHVEGKDVQFSYDENGMTYFNNVPNVMATVREDNHTPLGCVSSTYEIVQNEEVFTMLQPFVDMGGQVTSGGMTAEGLCFMVVTMNDIVAGGDNYTVNVMATNSFNGKYPAALICSPVRIICQNMYRQLMNQSDNVARFRHSLNIGNKLELIKSAYETFSSYQDVFAKQIDQLKLAKAKHSIEEFVELMFPYTNTNVNSPRFQSSQEKVDEKRAFYINHYYNSDTNSDFGTCFALVNAYYDYVSHDVPVRTTDEQYRGTRLSKLVGGTMVKPKLMNFMCETK